MAEDLITLQKALSEMSIMSAQGIAFSVMVGTFDSARRKGGKIVTLENVSKVKPPGVQEKQDIITFKDAKGNHQSVHLFLIYKLNGNTIIT